MRKYPHLLKEVKTSAPEEVFVSDITEQGIHYLSLVTDTYSRKIMGYELNEEMKATDVIKALDMTLKNRCYEHEVIHHSDIGYSIAKKHQVKLS